MKNFKRSVKNFAIVWGFLLAFILFDLTLELAMHDEQPIFFLPSFATLFLSFFLAYKMKKRLDFYDNAQDTLGTPVTVRTSLDTDTMNKDLT